MPLHMRMRKLRGPHMKKSMPFEMFRTHTQAVNLGALDARFESGAEVTLEALRATGLAKGKLTKSLTVHAHKFSGAAAATIEATGGTATVIEP